MSALRDACLVGDEEKVKSLVKQDPGIINKPDRSGWTGLLISLTAGHHSFTRWFLSLPGIDTNQRFMPTNFTALHIATIRGHPLNIVITLAKLANWNTVNGKTLSDSTALDLAFGNDTSAALYLSWLGAECRENRRNCYFTRAGTGISL